MVNYCKTWLRSELRSLELHGFKFILFPLKIISFFKSINDGLTFIPVLHFQRDASAFSNEASRPMGQAEVFLNLFLQFFFT